MKVVRREHPRGERGTTLSLEEVAKKAAEGRLDPEVRAWAIDKLIANGNPRDVKTRAAILLEALRKEVAYVPDPTDAEFIPGARCVLGKFGCDGLKLRGEDCDGLLVAYLAACGSVGIEGAVVGHGYDSPSGNLSHVLAAIYDGKQWYMADPSTKQPFGVVDRPARERWVAVPSGAVMCDSSKGQTCSPSGIGSGLRNMRPTGDFVGVGAPTDAAQRDPRFSGFDPSTQASMRNEVAARTQQLGDAIFELIVKHRTLQIIREEHLNKPIAEVGAAGSPGKWTQADEDYYQRLIPFADKAIEYGSQAAAGAKKVAYDTIDRTVVIVGSQSEPILDMDDQGNMSIQDLPGVPSGLVPSVYSGAVGSPGVAVLWFGGIVVVSLAVMGSVYRMCDTADRYIDYAKSTDLSTIHRAIAEKDGEAAANEAVSTIAGASAARARAEAEKARQQGAPLSGLFSALETGAWVVAGVGIVGAMAYVALKLWMARSVVEIHQESPRATGY